MKTTKTKILILEGVDKTGKTTLTHIYNKQNKYKYWVFDRSCISSYVYDILFNRNNKDYWSTLIKEMNDAFDVRVVLVDAENCDIEKRLKEANETLPKELSNIDNVKLSFHSAIVQHHLRYIKINTTYTSIDNCIKEIDNFMEKDYENCN